MRAAILMVLVLVLVLGGCQLLGQLYEGTWFTDNSRRHVIQNDPTAADPTAAAGDGRSLNAGDDDAQSH